MLNYVANREHFYREGKKSHLYNTADIGGELLSIQDYCFSEMLSWSARVVVFESAESMNCDETIHQSIILEKTQSFAYD